jgi:hypothetical protein
MFVVQIASSEPRPNSIPTHSDNGVAAQLRREQLQRHESHELVVVLGDVLSGAHGLPARWHGGETIGLDHAPADDRRQQRRHDADEENIAPAIATDHAVSPGAEERPERTAGHHAAGEFGAVRLAHGLGQQGNADHQFGAGAKAGDEAVDGEIPDTVRQALQRGEHAIDQPPPVA